MELVALVIMFFTLQAGSIFELGISLIAMSLLIFVLPPTFRLFVDKISPYAPHSEFTFLILMAFLAGVLTRELGAYYLVGAFVVGIIANRCEHALLDLRSEMSLQSLRIFFSFFIPFYFFKSGNAIAFSGVSAQGLIIGLVFLAVFVPIRLLSMVSSVRLFEEEKLKRVLQISISLLPTLVFGLVIASILKQEFSISKPLFHGLIIYTVIVSTLPALVLKKRSVGKYFDPI
jgi:Kef-type K+ transport system membrane component KefB